VSNGNIIAAIRNNSKGNVISRQLCEKDLPFTLSLGLTTERKIRACAQIRGRKV